jgi:hypothetical protein
MYSSLCENNLQPLFQDKRLRALCMMSSIATDKPGFHVAKWDLFIKVEGFCKLVL